MKPPAPPMLEDTLQQDWDRISTAREAYTGMPASPAKCRAAFDLIGMAAQFVVDHRHELTFLIQRRRWW